MNIKNGYTTIKNFFRKIKISLKMLYWIAIITILEIVCLLWYNNWAFTPAIIIALIQFGLIIEKRDVWSKLNKKEKEEILLSNNEFENFIKGIYALFEAGKTTEEVLEEIKKV